MQIKEQHILDLLCSNLQLLVCTKDLVSYLHNVAFLSPKDNPYKEIIAFWNENIYLPEDPVYQDILTAPQKQLMQQIHTSFGSLASIPSKVSFHSSKESKNNPLTDCFQTPQWLLIQEQADALLALLRTATTKPSAATKPTKTTKNPAQKVPEKQAPSYLPFETARTFVRSLKLKTTKDWQRYCQNKLSHRPHLPPNIPLHPDQVYRDKGWKSWTHWFGSNAINNFFKSKKNLKTIYPSS